MASAPFDKHDELGSEVPPAVTCATCTQPDCPGCEPQPSVFALTLAWEKPNGSLSERLWSTALATSLEPKKIFGAMPEGKLTKALLFAMVAETVGVASLGAVLFALTWAVSPASAKAVLVHPTGIGFAVGLSLGLSFGMVVLHALWGICVELGAKSVGHKARFIQGLRFGLYACGWDLLTSPAGVVHGLVARGPARAWGPIVAAMRVPRVAVRAYVDTYRKFDSAARRRGAQLSVLVLGSLVLLMGAALLLGPVLLYAHYLGY